MTITAKYEDGVFKPLEEVAINEGTIVEVRVPSYADRLKAKSRSLFYAIISPAAIQLRYLAHSTL